MLNCILSNNFCHIHSFLPGIPGLPPLLPTSKTFPYCYTSFLKKAARENKDRTSFVHGSSEASLQLVALLEDDGGTEGFHKPNIKTQNLT